MTDCLKCRYSKFGSGNHQFNPSGRYGVCVYGGGEPRILPNIEEYKNCRDYHAYDSPDWCPFNAEEKNEKNDEPKKEEYADMRCFGCKGLFVCDERFRCSRRLFMDTIEGPSGYLGPDNVLKASPEWCPGREPIESEKPVEEKKPVEVHWIGCVSGKTEITITIDSKEG